MNRNDWLRFAERVEIEDAEAVCKEFGESISAMSSRQMMDVLYGAKAYLEHLVISKNRGESNHMKGFSALINIVADEWERRFDAIYCTK